MDHLKVPLNGTAVLRHGRDIEIGCKSSSNHDHRHKIQGVRFSAKPSLDSIVAADGNQACTMFPITFDISLLWLFTSD